MNRSFHGDPDYLFGQHMLALRTRIGLTQEGLAAALGISRKTIGRWEAGDSYPSASRLQALLALSLQQGVFDAGQEAEQIRDFWKKAHQKVFLDDAWLSDLLAHYAPVSAKDVDELSSDTEQDHVVAVKPLALWTVPYPRNPHFTGRDELLSELERKLAPHASDQHSTLHYAALTQPLAIKGLGGIGKTQTAIEYAYRARAQGRYTHILWIAAASEETVLMSFVALAEQLPELSLKHESDQRKVATAVIRWLEHCPEPWLLIADNADELSVVQPYLPLQGQGDILLTTRSTAVGALATPVEVDVMGLLEGSQLLLRRARRFTQISDEEINGASNLVVALGQFPLALDQAGAYIEETGCSLQAYLEIYQTHRHALLARRGRQATGYAPSVATTWSLSFSHIEQQNPAAAELLQLCAFLAPDHIPEDLLTGGAPHWPAALQEATSDPFRFNQMLETLLAFSLVKRLGEDRLLSIHRLVQVVQMERLSQEEQKQWIERMVRALHEVFPHNPKEVASWPECQRYLEQVQACDTLVREHHLLLPEAAELFHQAALYLRENALFSQAEPLCQQALSIREQLLGETHPHSIQSMIHLASLYEIKRDYTAAEALYQRALALIEQQTEVVQLLLVNVLYGLALLCINQGKYMQAQPILQRAFHIWEHMAEAEQLQFFGVVTGLAFVLAQQDRYVEAEHLSQRVLRVHEQHLGSEHLQVAYTLLGLASVQAPQGKYAEAEPLLQRALCIREQHLGSEHLLIAVPLYELAKLYAEQGKHAEAEPLLQRALHIRIHVLGPDHPLTCDVHKRLHKVLEQLGQA